MASGEWKTSQWWRAVLLGGAIGDALGADIEFNSLTEIRRRFGYAGLQDLVEHDGRIGAITDDTQMTLFTAEAFLAFRRRAESYGMASFAPALYYSYQRWMATQGERPVPGKREVELRGLLFDSQDLHHRRGPGNTCLSALRSGIFGTVDKPINNSKGCGGVMRVAPLAEWGGLKFGETAAAITHGHPTGQLAAGALVVILHAIGAGATLDEAIDIALAELAERPSHEETSRALIGARELAASTAQTGPEAIEKLGEGWVAEEALAMAIYAALRAEGDFRAGVLLAVNHSGDSDSTGAIAGQILGALGGEQVLPVRWVEPLEALDVITVVATDLAFGVDQLRDDPDGTHATEHTHKYPYQ